MIDLEDIEVRAKAALRLDSWQHATRRSVMDQMAREDIPALVARVRELEMRLHGTNRQFDRLLNKVNVVTAFHRHGNIVTAEHLNNLSARQIEVEAWRDHDKKAHTT